MIRVGIELRQRKVESKISTKQNTKGQWEQWGKKKQEYTMRVAVKLKRFWTNWSKIAGEPQKI